MFQLLNPEMKQPPDYFPMIQSKGTQEKTSEQSWKPEEMIYYAYLTYDQSGPSMTYKPECLIILQ